MNRDYRENGIGLEVKGQAELILKGVGLRFLKPKFFKVDEATMFKEQDAINDAILNSTKTYSDSRSKFGLPVFDDILFDQLMYTDNNNKQIIVEAFSMGIALCEVSQSRNIVATQIAGRNGTVKEYVSDGDYMINIKGVLASLYQNVAPKDSLNQLLGFCTAPTQLNVASNFMAYFGIYTIVIKDYHFSQMEGERNVISFELSCLSDIDITIKGSKQTFNSQFI